MTFSTPLTENNLKIFDRMSSNPGATTSTHTHSTSASDPGFSAVSQRNGILRPETSKAPVNLKSIQTQTNRRRKSLEPDEAEYTQFLASVKFAANENTFIVESSHALLKRYPETLYRKTYDQSCHGFPKGVGFNNGLTQLQPDMIEALHREEFDPFPVSDELGGAAVFFTSYQQFWATLPHLAAEWKGPRGSLLQLEAQAAYDGAAMVYGRNTAREYLEAPDARDKSFISTFTIMNNGKEATLDMYAHYSAPSGANGDGPVKYHQSLISSTNLVANYKTFCRGRKRLRNLQDYSKAAAEKLRDELKAKWQAKERGVDGAGSDDDNDDAGQDDANDEAGLDDDDNDGAGSDDDDNDGAGSDDDDNDEAGRDDKNDETSDQDEYDDDDNAKNKDNNKTNVKEKGNIMGKAKGKRKAGSQVKDGDDADERNHSADVDADDGEDKHEKTVKTMAKTEVKKSGTGRKRIRK